MAGFLMLLCLIPTQSRESRLQVSQIQPTLGALGAPRPDGPYLPGDILHVAFNVSGLTLDAEGRYRVAATLQIDDPAGKPILSEDYGALPPRTGMLAGGQSRFAFRYFIPLDLPAGPYKAKLQLTDLFGKQSVPVEYAFKVSAPAFGLVRFQAGRGPQGQAETPPTGVRGEVLHLRVTAVGLSKGRDGQGSLEFTVEVQDGQHKTLGKPQINPFPQVIADEPVALQFELPLDQAGKFFVLLKATDKNSNKSATLTVPVTVVD